MPAPTYLTRSRSRLFVAVNVPPKIKKSLKEKLPNYDSVLSKTVSSGQWHVRVAWLDVGDWAEAKDTSSLPQQYVATMRVTHIGQGRSKNQLWAYIQPTKALISLREQILEKFAVKAPGEEFVPHINLGTLTEKAQKFGPPESLVGQVFTYDYAVMYENDIKGEEPENLPKFRIDL